MRAVILALAGALAMDGCVANAPVDDADPQGTLTTAITIDPQLDPQLAANVGEIGTISMVFEPLLRFDPKTLRPVPAAARALPDVSADRLTYRLTIRDDAKYSDGSPVRAKDFAYGISRLCDPSTKPFYAQVAYIIVGCAEWSQLDPKTAAPETLKAAKQRLSTEGIRAAGEKELTIALRQPATYFSSILALWLAVPVRDSDVEHGGNTWTEPATYIGNGPFVLNAWRHNERLILTPNRYYRTPPKIRQWTKLLIGEPAVALNAYRHDELDLVAYGNEAGALVPEIEGDASLKNEFARTTTPCTNWIAFNSRRPPLDDTAVRLALAKGINREAYVRDILGGIGAPAVSFIAPGLPGYDPGDTAQRFDPSEARRLLGSSRYSGAMPPIVITHMGGLFGRARAQWVADQWRTNLGLDVRTDQMDGLTLNQLYRKAETVPLFTFGGWCADYPDQQDWLSVVFRSAGRTEGVVFNSGFLDGQFDRIVDEADRGRDQARRDDLYRTASRMLSERAVVAFTNTVGRVTLTKPWVRGVVQSPLDIDLGAMTGTSDRIFIAKKGR